jgi:plasmid stabilization system protein ParE
VTYRFLSPAFRDLAGAVDYYNTASPGLGGEFLDEIEATIRRIVLNPEAWTKVSPSHRRCRTRRFPYGLIYSVEGDAILVAAVMHLHRHPNSWKNDR